MLYRHLILLCALAAAQAASAADDEGGLWAGAAVSKLLSENVSAGALVQLRFIDELERLERVLLRPHVAYRPRAGHAFSLGYDAHFIDTPSAKVEQRLWQEYQVSRPFSGFSGALRFRFEERFIDHVDGVPVRLRAKASIKMPVAGSPWSFTVANEAFLSVKDIRGGQRDGFHENRAYAGFGRRLGDGPAIAVGYQNQWLEGARRDRMIHQLVIGLGFALP
ncbi:MAG: DUF2490 domain-containing protein [Gammaproteobacteria bacterium]